MTLPYKPLIYNFFEAIFEIQKLVEEIIHLGIKRIERRMTLGDEP